jgi:hypothetical protein
MGSKKIIFDKNKTIIIFFDMEFYVPKEDRIENGGFQANPYNDNNILIGGSFLKHFPLNDKKEDELLKYWIWDYDFKENEMLIDIVQYFIDSWNIVKSKQGQCDLIVCGIGISRIDIAYLIGRCFVNKILDNKKLFEIFNHLRIIDLENLALPFFKSKNGLLYPKNTSEINLKFHVNSKREPGIMVWDYYDEKEYEKISERTLNEIMDQKFVYKEICKYCIIKALPPKYSCDSVNKILMGLKNKMDKDFFLNYYILSQEEEDRYYLSNEINDNIKYSLIQLITKSGYYQNKVKNR